MERRISPAEAHRKMRQGIVYVDVRTPEEFADGHPEGALNVPLDDRFVETMTTAFRKDVALILGCQAGRRSARAFTLLEDAGFTDLFDQRAGFDGTRGTFGEITEPGWARTDLPRAVGPSASLPRA